MPNPRPIVYLVGAGPGDPGLITARGLKCLAAADVVLYDHLINARLLRFARSDAERIDLGASAPKPLEQEAICYLLAEKAREGKVVTRLKWGDPFVFDRGGAEALFLHEQGVPFEVIPGVPAAIGMPTYAGIPVTYPGGGDTLTFVRGHEDEGDLLPQVDWSSLARLEGAIVCYAGMRQMPGIVHALIAHGRPKDEPAAIIYDGTLPTQETIDGTLGDMEAVAKQPPRRSGAILVVGRVVALRQHLRWFDERPLFGKRVLITRTHEQAEDLVDQLEAQGAEAIESPTIRVLPPDDYGPLDEACVGVASFAWIVFASANSVDAFMLRLRTVGKDIRELKGVRLCAIGPATADRLLRHGINVDLLPPEYRTEGVIQALTGTGSLKGVRILLPRADIGRELLTDELRKAGAEVTEVTAYRTVLAEAEGEGDPNIYKMLLEKRIDIVTFTSASTVRNFVRLFGSEVAADLLRSTSVACIGPVTAEAAEQCGIPAAIVPAQYTIPALVEAIVAYFSDGQERQRKRVDS
jgi:uroporphyrinogen III methyltransferase / synthase